MQDLESGVIWIFELVGVSFEKRNLCAQKQSELLTIPNEQSRNAQYLEVV